MRNTCTDFGSFGLCLETHILPPWNHQTQLARIVGKADCINFHKEFWQNSRRPSYIHDETTYRFRASTFHNISRFGYRIANIGHHKHMWPSQNTCMCNSLQFHAECWQTRECAICPLQFRDEESGAFASYLSEDSHTQERWSRLRRCVRTQETTIRPSEISVKSA